MMTSRERVLCALNHEEPDRVPVFFGTSGATTMLAPAYEQLKAHLGLTAPTHLMSRSMQYAKIDDSILERLGSDGRMLSLGAVPSPLRRELTATAFVDEWGITWEMRPGTLYYEAVEPPLREASIQDLERYPWPDLTHPDRFAGVAEEARRLHEETEYAVVGVSGAHAFEMIFVLRGLDQFLLDMVTDPEFSHAILRKVTDVMVAGLTRFMEVAGESIDVLVMGDDLGMQKTTLMSPEMYRRIIKPYHAELIAAVKNGSEAKVFFHSDGNIYSLIGDLIELGVDLLNPVQVSAGDMGDTARLKREFGDRLAFCGAIDTQRVLPHGTPDDVRREVRRRIRDLGPGGGYILAPVHCIQPDVPPENVLAMLAEAQRAGRYPLDL
jgi:uroporphyrinogen decarboxylase